MATFGSWRKVAEEVVGRRRRPEQSTAETILTRTKGWSRVEMVDYCDGALLGHIGRHLSGYRSDGNADHIREALMHLDVAGVLLERVLAQEEADL